MKLIKASHLFDGINERKDVFIGIENDTIQHVDINKPKEEAKVIMEDKDIVITLHSSILIAVLGCKGLLSIVGNMKKTNKPILLVRLLLHYIVYTWTTRH